MHAPNRCRRFQQGNLADSALRIDDAQVRGNPPVFMWLVESLPQLWNPLPVAEVSRHQATAHRHDLDKSQPKVKDTLL